MPYVTMATNLIDKQREPNNRLLEIIDQTKKEERKEPMSS